MGKNTVFTGAGVAIITPFSNGKIDFDALGEIIEFQIANKTDAIIICGTTGESSTMTDDEHIDTIEYCVKKVNKRVPVIAGTGSNDTAYCVFLSKEAEKVGADALLISTPYYNKASQKGLALHFKTVADAVNIPIILYNIPGRTGMGISIECLKDVARHPNIVGLKEASGDISYFVKAVAEVGDDIDFYSGNDDMIVPVMSLGGKGVISVLSNVMPKETHDIVQSYIDGDVETSRRLQIELLDLINALFIEVNPIPVKTAMNLMGFKAGELRMPLCDMMESNLEKLKIAMKNHNLI